MFWPHWVFIAARGLSLVAAHGLLVAVALLVVEHGLQGTGSVVVVYGLCCSAACGISLDQGSNPCLLHWQANSYPWSASFNDMLKLFF